MFSEATVNKKGLQKSVVRMNKNKNENEVHISDHSTRLTYALEKPLKPCSIQYFKSSTS